MTVTIDLTPEKEQELRERAAAFGQDIVAYVQQLIERDAKSAPLSLDEILAPVRKDFHESGMTEEELDSVVEEVRDDIWSEGLPGKGLHATPSG